MLPDTDVPRHPTRAPSADAERAAVAAARRSRHRHLALVWGVRILLVTVGLSAWELAARYWVDFDGRTHFSKPLDWKDHAQRWGIDQFFYSQPSQIWQRLHDWFTVGPSSGPIWEHIGVTLWEATSGFVIGSIAGVVLGILLGRARFAAEVLAPFIKAANAIPRIVLASLFVIWFGLGLSSKIATAVVLVFFAVFFNAFQGAREVDRNLVNNARILGASRTKVLTSIVIPSATSWILASLHVAFGFALIGAVVGEVIGAKRGLGLLIAHSQGTFDAAGIYAGMIIITVVALGAEWLLTALEKRLLRWRPPSASEASHV
ncbi:ABC transporter permease [Dactylosporangium sp. NPDC050588]|uniref:ABC transporter permease n=1 Tax=Dactylosporangium sp. NPDC050588 TaxID=3157211 RepID=UPI0033FCB900